MPIRGVVFDLGGTLLHYKEAGTTWEDMEKRGMRASYRLLHESGYTLPPEGEALDTAWEYLLSVWTYLDNHPLSELNMRHQLQAVADRWGVDGIEPDLLDRLPIVYMQAIQVIVAPLDGAGDTLRALRSQGLKLGLISNTLWPGSFHQQDMEHYGLISYFDHLIFSADAGAWKPRQAVFQLSLNALHLQPDEAFFVGDSLYFDVWGAQQAGMRGVWVEQEHRWQPDGMDIQPDATIRQLSELLDVVNSWE